jgi:predicted transcriptional regulator
MGDSDSAHRAVADIVVAFLAHNRIDESRLPGLVISLRAALTNDLPNADVLLPETQDSEAADVEESVDDLEGRAVVALQPAVPIAESVHHDYLLSLEDGKQYRSLRRHLMAKYGMTPDDYRRKWGLPADYPMVAPSYAEERSEVAKRTGLGKSENRTAVRGKRS